MKIFVIGGTSQADEQSPQDGFLREKQILQTSMQAVGLNLARAGHEILVCSPFKGSSDVEVVRGAAGVASAKITFYYPNARNVLAELDQLQKSLGSPSFVRFPQQPPADETSREAWRNAWLLSQLSAMKPCNLIIAVGGTSTGSMSLLLPLAESWNKDILPLRFLGGASEMCFERKRYELQDRLGNQTSHLGLPEGVDKLDQLIQAFGSRQPMKRDPSTNPAIFLSYAKARPEEADFVEMFLRRRNLTVLRNDNDFTPGSPLPTQIRDYIHKAQIFVAIWCKEYACSPWCFDELELALDRSQAGVQTIFLLNIDDTRIVPPRARPILAYPALSRQALEGELVKLLERLAIKATRT